MMKMNTEQLRSAIVAKIVAARNAKQSVINRLTEAFRSKLQSMPYRNDVAAFLTAEQDMYGEQALSLLISSWRSGFVSRLVRAGGPVTEHDIDANVRTLKHLLSSGVFKTCQADSLIFRQGIKGLMERPLDDEPWSVVTKEVANHSHWRIFWHDNMALLVALVELEKTLEELAKQMLQSHIEDVGRMYATKKNASSRRNTGSCRPDDADEVFPGWIWMYWIMNDDAEHLQKRAGTKDEQYRQDDGVYEISANNEGGLVEPGPAVAAGVAAAVSVSSVDAENLGSYS